MRTRGCPGCRNGGLERPRGRQGLSIPATSQPLKGARPPPKTNIFDSRSMGGLCRRTFVHGGPSAGDFFVDDQPCASIDNPRISKHHPRISFIIWHDFQLIFLDYVWKSEESPWRSFNDQSILLIYTGLCNFQKKVDQTAIEQSSKDKGGGRRHICFTWHLGARRFDLGILGWYYSLLVDNSRKLICRSLIMLGRNCSNISCRNIIILRQSSSEHFN